MIRSFVLAIAFAIAPFTISSVDASEAPPLSVYGELPAFEDASISPSGEKIAIIATLNGMRGLHIINADNALLKSVPVENLKVFGIDWIGEDQILMRISQTEDLPPFWGSDQAEMQQMLIVPVNSNKRAERIFENDRGIMDRVFGFYGMRNVDGKWKGYFGGIELARSSANRYVLGNSGTSLFEVDFRTNRARRVAVDTADATSQSWMIDANGDDAATIERNRETGRWRILNGEGDNLADGQMAITRVGLYAFGADGKSVIYWRENEGTKENEFFSVPLDGSSAPREVFSDHDEGRRFVDRTTRRYLGYVDSADLSTADFENAEFGEVVTNIYRAFPDSNVRIVEWTPDFRKFLVRTDGEGDSGSWYVVNLSAGEAKMFGLERPSIAPEQVGSVSRLYYTARDGLAMDGILTLPPGREPQNLPLVMLPHGGPHAEDIVHFDWWAQAFASRGYAVFQPNFRGSTSQDAAFRNAGYGEWGKKMQTDITDGLEMLVEKGIVDRERACIMGASYGGYAALAGVTIEQGIYRCSVAVAPVTDIGLTIRTDTDSGMGRRVLMEEFGEGVDYDAVSPRKLADRADAPILLIHGREDTVVPYRQSKVMADALRDAGKPFEMVELEAEDHWLTRSTTRLQMLEAAVGFVEKHNPAD